MPEKKYTDLIISLDLGKRPSAWEVLNWLDEHPEEVPRPTVTRTERDAATEGLSPDARFVWTRGFEAAGGTVVPDPQPKPTSTEHDRDWWVENANTGDIEDCDACVESGDLCPVHFGMGEGAEFVARKLRALGADPELFDSLPDPVTAPGGEE